MAPGLGLFQDHELESLFARVKQALLRPRGAGADERPSSGPCRGCLVLLPWWRHQEQHGDLLLQVDPDLLRDWLLARLAQDGAWSAPLRPVELSPQDLAL